MTKEEVDLLRGVIAPDPKIRVDDLTDQSDRTLLYGYTLDRDTFHVYLKDGIMHRVIYSFKRYIVDHIEGEELDAHDLSPCKRAYPERTDFEFAKALRIRDVHVSLTTFTEGVEKAQYYGLTLEQLKRSI